MTRKGTLLWRFAVLVMLLAVVPVGISTYEAQRRVDPDAMLNVSVSIRTVSHVERDRFGDSVWQTSSGSGFLVSNDPCEVWTNQHVVAEAAIIEVFPRGWTGTNGIPAEVLNATPRHDVAILRVESCAGIEPVTIGNSQRIEVGEDTYAVGNPLGRNPDSISRGIISHTERYMDGTTPYLQTDAAINPGNSGGALFNRRGEVIGMNSAIAATKDGVNVGIGYAIPINLVADIVAELKAGPPSWGDAGLDGVLSALTPDEATVFRVPTGLGAVSVTADPKSGPSHGKLRARDAVYRVGDHLVHDVHMALRAFASHKPGALVSVDLVRSGVPLTVELELADGWKAAATRQPDFYSGHLGMALEMWTEDEDGRGRFEHPVITQIHSLGPAHRSLISSSQHAAVMQGPFMVRFQLDVKTITGVVYRGEYHPIPDTTPLRAFAASAYESGDPLLLEIQLWRREDPRDLEKPLEHKGTAFYKINPAPSGSEYPLDDWLVNGETPRATQAL